MSPHPGVDQVKIKKENEKKNRKEYIRKIDYMDLYLIYCQSINLNMNIKITKTVICFYLLTTIN